MVIGFLYGQEGLVLKCMLDQKLYMLVKFGASEKMRMEFHKGQRY